MTPKSAHQHGDRGVWDYQAMASRVSWQLIGTDQRVLDRGHLDGTHEHPGPARAEILTELNKFAVHGDGGKPDQWWARRSQEAVIVITFCVEQMSLPPAPSEAEPALSVTSVTC